MVDEILANLYKIEIPLPQNPLKALKSYVIKTSERNLIVDTGWNQQQCMDAMRGGLRELGVDLKKTDFFITHFHADHLGLISNIATETSTIYFNQADSDRIKSGVPWNDIAHFARLNGYPEHELQMVPHSHPGFKFRSKGNLAFHILREDNTIRIGEYIFKWTL